MTTVRSLTDWFRGLPDPAAAGRSREATRSTSRPRPPRSAAAERLRSARALRDQARVARARRLARSATAAPFVWSIAPVELRSHAEAAFLVQLGGLRERLRELASPARWDGLEICGYLYGFADYPTPSVRLDEAHPLNQPNAVRSWGGITGERLLAGRSIADRERMAGPGGRPGQVGRLVGDWHTHPTPDGTPSKIDLDGWARELDHEAQQRTISEYVGLILTPDERLPATRMVRWTVNAWVLRRRKYGSGFTCEPARVEE